MEKSVGVVSRVVRDKELKLEDGKTSHTGGAGEGDT